MKFTNLQASQFLLGELEHPNKMPFGGILTYLDIPSDMAPHGSNGKKVIIPSNVGIPALNSLIGMAVNYVEGTMDDHNPTNKIGIITSAEAGERTENGVPVYVQGFIYANDFPQAALDIKLNQSVLGFSYETTNTLLIDGVFEDEAVAVVTQVVFTGASILYAADAAYTTTTLAASAETETNKKEGDISMELTELMASIEKMFDAKLEEFKKEIQASAVEEEVQAASEEVTESVETTEEESEDEVEESHEEEGTQEIDLNAAAELKAELEAVKAELAEIKASADLQAAARKSIVYPVTLMAKYGLSEEEEETKVMASIDSREDLSIQERLTMKMELLDKKRKAAK